MGNPTHDKLVDCLRNGWKHNNHLKASQPWKLFYPDEVVVVVVIDELKDRRCKIAGAAKHSNALGDTICDAGTETAEQSDSLDAHLRESDKTSMTGDYIGLHSGAGFPHGTPSEVVLRPEDIL